MKLSRYCRSNYIEYFQIFPVYLTTLTRHKINASIQWCTFSPALQNASSINMVHQDRFRSMTVYGKLFLNILELFTPKLSFQLCSILPLNIVNEKTYIFIWFWYLILLVMLIGLVIYRLLIIFVPSVRARVLNARNRMVPREIAVSVSNKVDIGDWWIIYMLGRNLDPIIYKDVLAELAKSISVPSKKSKT